MSEVGLIVLGAALALFFEHFWTVRRATRVLHDWTRRTDGQVTRSLGTHRELLEGWLAYEDSVRTGGPLANQPPNTTHYARVIDVEAFVLEHYLAVPDDVAWLILVCNSACRDADREIESRRAWSDSLSMELLDPDTQEARDYAARTAQVMGFRLRAIVATLERAQRAMADLKVHRWAPSF